MYFPLPCPRCATPVRFGFILGWARWSAIQRGVFSRVEDAESRVIVVVTCPACKHGIPVPFELPTDGIA